MPAFEFTYDYPNTSPERLFAVIADPKTIERMAPFPITVMRLREGKGDPNGVGSVRRIRPFFMAPYDEEILVFEPHRRIEYMFLKGGPIRNHRGAYIIEPTGPGSRFRFTLRYEITVPGVSKPFNAILRQANKGGFDRLHRLLESGAF